MDNNLIIDQLVSILANTPIVELAYLFGSQVRGTTGPISDIDLGVLFADKVNTLSASSKLAYELQKALQSQQIDIVALRDVPIELAYAIIAEGICIYQRDNTTRVEFEAHVLSRYGDYLPVLLSQRQEILGDESDDRRVQWYREALRRTERTLSKIRSIQE